MASFEVRIITGDMKMQKTVSIDTAIENVRNEMLRLAYSKLTIKTHEYEWEKFRKYAVERNVKIFTAEIAEDFLSDTLNYPNVYASGTPLKQGTISKIRSIRVLQDFHFFGKLPGMLRKQPSKYPEPYNETFEKYRKHCDVDNRNKHTKTQYMTTAGQFTQHLLKRDVANYGAVTVADVDDFIVLQQGYTKHTVKMKFRILKAFLCFLYNEGHIIEDFSDRIPRVRTYTKGRIPATLSIEQAEQIMKSFDRGNPIGKRDYAVMIFALELGIRSCDIKNLRFDDIDWVQKCIKIIQDKTNKTLELPMPNNVSNAVIEYLKHGRPESKSSFVFIKHKAPYNQGIDTWKIMRQALSSAGIRIEDESTKGLHLLRHTLGTNLLKNGVPLSTIAEILGHRNVTTTEIYVHTDTDGLRKCALDTEVFDNG
jgi:site-specific recombinase XerD